MSWSERGTLPLSLKACPPCPDRPHLHGVTLPRISRTTALRVSKPCFYPGGFPRTTRQNQTTFLSAVHSTKQAARPAGEAPRHRSRRPQPGHWPMPTREALSLYLCRGGVLRGRVLERKGSRCVYFVRLLHYVSSNSRKTLPDVETRPLGHTAEPPRRLSDSSSGNEPPVPNRQA